MASVYVILILSFLQCIAFIIYGVDKVKAIKNLPRISEKKLLYWALCAPIGSSCAMETFRHKISKKSFLHKVIPLIILGLIVNIFIVIISLYFFV
ncbi:MAG: uncharacterized membrane protein YsdA (DUF1294 family) [Francisellaceae bacterium]|jgi:uncharacterized membrane protein YsdA (DUF1294 family)